LELSSYNGWENKFTWLVYLHLSNEQSVTQEIATLVANKPNYCPAGRLVEMWVKSALANWYTCFPGRNRHYDEYVRLLVWGVVSSALAYADWDTLVALLAGETVSSTMMLRLRHEHENRAFHVLPYSFRRFSEEPITYLPERSIGAF